MGSSRPWVGTDEATIADARRRFRGFLRDPKARGWTRDPVLQISKPLQRQRPPSHDLGRRGSGYEAPLLCGNAEAALNPKPKGNAARLP